LWARNVIETRITDEENTIIESDLGWEIRVRGNLNEIGRLQIKEYEIGVLISYWSKTDDGWNVVNKFMNQLFAQLKLDGYTVIPRDKKPIEDQVRELRKKYQKSDILVEKGSGISTQSGKRKNMCDDLLPTGKAAKEKWKKVYEIIKRTRHNYLEEYKDSSTKPGIIKLPDFQDAIANELNITIGERTLRKIIKAGDMGCLR
jgi:hypothetical protein